VANRARALMLCALLILGGVMLFAPPPVRAHAELVEAAPAPGQVYRWERPHEVRLEFSQQLVSASISVTTRDFQEVQGGEARIRAEDPFEVVLALPDLEPGTYSVNWRSASIDGHSVEGSYEFTILPRQPVVTVLVTALVLPLIGLLVFLRRDRTGGAEIN
jgi:methionine-rich copper-binding protein CopC